MGKFRGNVSALSLARWKANTKKHQRTNQFYAQKLRNGVFELPFGGLSDMIDFL